MRDPRWSRLFSGDGRKHLSSACCKPASTYYLHALVYDNLINYHKLPRRQVLLFSSHFTYKETEAKIKETAQVHTTNKRCIWDLNHFLMPKLVFSMLHCIFCIKFFWQIQFKLLLKFRLLLGNKLHLKV